MITATRFHDFSCGHRVVGHEGKCKYLHGHNYRVHFTVTMKQSLDEAGRALDSVGRVLDFSAINSRLCQWLEREWDHKMLLWEKDPQRKLFDSIMVGTIQAANGLEPLGLVYVPFNPTAENMAQHLLYVIGPEALSGTNAQLIAVTVEETRKCSAHANFAPSNALNTTGDDDAPSHID